MQRGLTESMTTMLVPTGTATRDANGLGSKAAPAAELPSASRKGRAAHREVARLSLLAVLVVVACVIARSNAFTAGSDLGYWLGVAGGTAMLLLFSYPLRKRWRAVRELGSTRFWFSFHMTLGIAGPLLIVVHSTLRFGSVNATVAFVSMAFVAGSGVMGRYLYTQIHHGLYGRRASLAELRARTGLDSAKLRSKLALVPEVELQLNEFARRAEETRHTGLIHPLRFLALGLHATVARRHCTRLTTETLRRVAASNHWSAEKLARRIERHRRLIARHLSGVQRIAQFAVFERLFSVWHVLHVPLVYIMVLSAIAHVVAVHMY